MSSWPLGIWFEKWKWLLIFLYLTMQSNDTFADQIKLEFEAGLRYSF